MKKDEFGLDTSQMAAWVLALVLTGCGGGGAAGDAGSSRTPHDEIARLEASGELPVLGREPTLGGIDANANGVRDDIERYIEKTYTEPAQRKAAMQTARAFQRMLLLDKSDPVAVDAVVVARCEGPIGCMCSSELSLRDWELPHPQNSQGTQPDEHP